MKIPSSLQKREDVIYYGMMTWLPPVEAFSMAGLHFIPDQGQSAFYEISAPASSNLARMVGLPLVSFLMDKSSALSLANRS